MKFILLAFAVFSAAVSAAPEAAESRFVDLIIIGMIEDLSQSIRDQGLDPLNVENEKYVYSLPVTNLLRAEAEVVDLLVEGLSNIRVNSMSFSLIGARLTLDISLPGIDAHIGSADASVKLGHIGAGAHASGTLKIQEIRVRGDIRLYIPSLNFRDANLELTLGNIESALNVVLLGNDISNDLNHLLQVVVPRFVEEFKTDISEVLEYIVGQIVDNVL